MDMQWIVTIDVPFWVAALQRGLQEWEDLLRLIDEVQETGNLLLFRPEITSLAQRTPDNSWLLYSKLSKVSTVSYASDQKAAFVKSYPDVTEGVTDPKQKNEICQQMAFLYSRPGALPRPLLASMRVAAKEVVLQSNHKNERKVFVCGTMNGDIQKRIADFQPILKQDKHFQFERKLGKGKVASTFSAYDKNNKSVAENLLKQAFMHYTGEELPAKNLWVKDEVNSCYVRFMHSGNNCYHGYDEKDHTKVPEDVITGYTKD